MAINVIISQSCVGGNKERTPNNNVKYAPNKIFQQTIFIE